jgi:hypothetical protein
VAILGGLVGVILYFGARKVFAMVDETYGEEVQAHAPKRLRR